MSNRFDTFDSPTEASPLCTITPTHLVWRASKILSEGTRSKRMLINGVVENKTCAALWPEVFIWFSQAKRGVMRRADSSVSSSGCVRVQHLSSPHPDIQAGILFMIQDLQISFIFHFNSLALLRGQSWSLKCSVLTVFTWTWSLKTLTRHKWVFCPDIVEPLRCKLSPNQMVSSL